MRHLKIWQKLLLMGFVFMLPFAMVTWSLVSSINTLGVGVARQELLGLEYETTLLALLKDLQQHRGMANAWLGGDAAFKEPLLARRADIERDLKALDDTDARLGGALRVPGRARTLKEAVTALLDQVQSLSLTESFQRHTQLIADLLALASDIGDSSNLTLDPNVDSYYLMAAGVMQGPELTEALGQARALGSRLLASKGKRGDLVDKLKDLASRADYLSLQMNASLNKVFAANPDMKLQLREDAEGVAAAVHDGLRLAQNLAASGDVGLSAQDYFAALTRSIDTVFAAEAHVFAALSEVLNLRIAGLERQVRDTLVAAGLGLLVVWLIGVWIIRDITRPLRRVVRIANEIADGDLSANVEAEHRGDEIGVLSHAFDRMVAFLREMVHVTEQIASGNLSVAVKPQSDRDLVGDALLTMVRNLSTLVGQVQKSGIQVASSVNQIAATSKQQQATASEIAATTMEIGATSREITVTSKELVTTVGEVSRVADQSALLAGSGQAGLTHMEETMRHVVEAAAAINSKLTVLNEKAGNIGQVITTISKVADQTNLLSLNAAIEAEKAGEYGRGFSVVATEIRRLADQTAVATYDIEQMVKEIQSAVSAGVMGMDKFSEEVRRGMQDVQQVGGQLTQIIQQVQALAPRFEAVNEGMQAQATGAEQITQALAQLNEAAQQTVESLRQSTQAIDGLNDVSGGLRSGVSRFKLAAVS
jgi:methyl-accepting chemotaxis protein WspA